jgi:hypothetical protein
MMECKADLSFLQKSLNFHAEDFQVMSRITIERGRRDIATRIVEMMWKIHPVGMMRGIVPTQNAVLVL